jgi:hypothetical protein
LVQLADFKKIVRNYLQMKSLLADESTCCWEAGCSI